MDAPEAPAAPDAPGMGGGDAPDAPAMDAPAAPEAPGAPDAPDAPGAPDAPIAPGGAYGLTPSSDEQKHGSTPTPSNTGPSGGAAASASGGGGNHGMPVGQCPLTVPHSRVDGEEVFYQVNVTTHAHHSHCERTYEQFETFDAKWRQM